MMRLTSIFGLLCVAALAGCGGGTDTAFHAGVNESEPVNQLSDSDVRQVCERLQDYLQTQVFSPERIQTATCTVAGVAAENTFDGVTCEESVRDCTSDPPQATIDFVDCTAIDNTVVSGCSATVGQLEDCVNEISGDVNHIYDQLTCSLADDPDWQTKLQNLADQLQTTSCAELDPGCPFAGFGVDVPDGG